MEVKEGNDAKLQCTVTAKPKPNIEWFKKGVQIKENRRVKFENDGESIALTIKEARSFDEGEYKCVATNEIDSASCAATLKVRVVTKPEFKDKLKTVEVTEGDAVQFDARVDGYPVPAVQWFKGISKLKSDGRIEFKENPDENLFSLEICDTQLEDAGMYKCEASNQGGKGVLPFVLLLFSAVKLHAHLCSLVIKSVFFERLASGIPHFYSGDVGVYALLCMHMHLYSPFFLNY